MDTESATATPAGLIARLRSLIRSLLGGSGEASLTKRLAGTIFIIRVVSAALAYLSQILLARWSKASICCCPIPTCWCCSNSARRRKSASISRS